jgi:hypothetical protein
VGYLRQHDFAIEIRPIHSSIVGGLFSSFDPLLPKPQLRIVFVENPEHQLPVGGYTPWSFLSQTCLDDFMFQRIHRAFPASIRKTPKKKETPNGFTNCIISTWVSLLLNKRFLSY